MSYHTLEFTVFNSAETLGTLHSSSRMKPSHGGGYPIHSFSPGGFSAVVRSIQNMPVPFSYFHLLNILISLTVLATGADVGMGSGGRWAPCRVIRNMGRNWQPHSGGTAWFAVILLSFLSAPWFFSNCFWWGGGRMTHFMKRWFEGHSTSFNDKGVESWYILQMVSVFELCVGVFRHRRFLSQNRKIKGFLIHGSSHFYDVKCGGILHAAIL